MDRRCSIHIHFALTRLLIGSCAFAVVYPFAATAAPAQGLENVPGQAFPYVAFVNQDNAYVRSGPSERHYPTGALKSGAAVEVFRHDQGGWCAVRPPHGAYSLVATRSLRVIDQNTAEVISDDAVARVGSQLSPQKQAVQIMLKRGERIGLLGPIKSGDEWARIAPPSGEFRWVAAKDISLQPPFEAKPLPTPNVNSSLTAASHFGVPKVPWRSDNAASSNGSNNTSPTPADALQDAFTHLQSAPPTNPLPASAIPTQLPLQDTSSEEVRIVEGSPAELQQAQLKHAQYEQAQLEQAQSSPAAPPLYAAGVQSSGTAQPASNAEQPNYPAANPPIAGSTPPRIKFRQEAPTLPENQRIAELQVRLSRTVIQPPKQWNLVALREETAVLLANEQQPAAREQYRELLERIAVFEQVQKRYEQPLPGAIAAAKPQTAGGLQTAPIALPASQANGVAATIPVDADQVEIPDVELPEGLAGSTTTTGPPLFTPDTAALRSRIQEDLGTAPVQRSIPASVAAPRSIAASQVDPFDSTPSQTSVNQQPIGTEEAKYDAVGTLKPVVSRRAKAPRYALVNDVGEVVSFVTPTPDVNLQRFVGRRVGIQGKRGYMPDYKRAHVTASRVNPLGSVQRR
ncbi:SH3 domain-containing protein [Adhaeretor mobilis]|uniref:SH3 domain-containing protein n=1 Tax=Adhaeretor mobilis TaxID=1930276 RepID=A0A517MV53_9BACT|nr:SH3 domain-containing protein [Adhaeretor mobilis]QDS98760.1 hypothetical protein HG15A2_20440 [Adhaeretor mobilis]